MPERTILEQAAQGLYPPREVVFLGARHVGSGVSWDLNLSSTTCQLGTLGPSEPSDPVSSSVKRGH